MLIAQWLHKIYFVPFYQVGITTLMYRSYAPRYRTQNSASCVPGSRNDYDTTVLFLYYTTSEVTSDRRQDLPIDSGKLSNNKLKWEAMDIKNWLCSLPHLNTEKNTEPKSHPEIKEVE